MAFKHFKNDRYVPKKISYEKEEVFDRFKTHAIFRGSIRGIKEILDLDKKMGKKKLSCVFRVKKIAKVDFLLSFLYNKITSNKRFFTIFMKYDYKIERGYYG